MSIYKFFHVDRLLCVTWTASPTVAAIDQLEADSLQAHRRVKERLVAIVNLGPMSVPEAPVRARLDRYKLAMREAIELSVVVIPAQGLMASLLRTAFRASVMLTGTRDQMRIAASTEEALEVVLPRLAMEPAEVRRLLRAQGLLAGALAQR